MEGLAIPPYLLRLMGGVSDLIVVKYLDRCGIWLSTIAIFADSIIRQQ